ncbi:MAG: DNA alkylation repair protein [Rikenellaceae bacterium]
MKICTAAADQNISDTEGNEANREVGREANREVNREVGREVGREANREVNREVGREVGREGSRLVYLLGEVRRQKNGAVADFMRFYGERYGLNYGVSLPTIRSLAQAELSASESEQARHKFAKLLYKQEVRELRLIALWLADIEQVTTNNEIDFWGKGIINSELAEEAAFALIYRSELFDQWLDSTSTLLQYSAVMAMSKRVSSSRNAASECIEKQSEKLTQLIDTEPHIIPKAVVALLDSALKSGVEIDQIKGFLDALHEGGGSRFINEEIAWRLEFR